MTLLCDACTALGDRHHAERLYEALRPYSGINVVAGFGVICFGSAARFLGKLAATLGRSAAAAEHLEQALAENARLDAPALVAHTQLDLAAALGEGARAQRLLDEAAATAAELGLTAVARRAAHLGGR